MASAFTAITSMKHALVLGNIYDSAQTRDAQLELDQQPGKKRKLEDGSEEISGSSQPWVELMKRRLPVIQLENGTWRGLVKGMAVEPYKVSLYLQTLVFFIFAHIL